VELPPDLAKAVQDYDRAQIHNDIPTLERLGKHQTRLLRVAYVWAKRNGHWQATYTQVTRVPQ